LSTRQFIKIDRYSIDIPVSTHLCFHLTGHEPSSSQQEIFFVCCPKETSGLFYSCHISEASTPLLPSPTLPPPPPTPVKILIPCMTFTSTFNTILFYNCFYQRSSLSFLLKKKHKKPDLKRNPYTHHHDNFLISIVLANKKKRIFGRGPDAR
jgi:hypothetical protein